MSDYTWSLGTLVGLPAAGLLVLICIVWIVVARHWWRLERASESSYSEESFALGILVSGVISLLVVIGATAWFMYPWKAEYHQWRTESGVVTQVDSRLLGQDKSTTQRFVVTLDDNRQRSCDDTRCAQVQVGDRLTLSCKRAWQYAGTDGYDCNFVARERGTQ